MLAAKLFFPGSASICIAVTGIIFADCGELPFSFHKLHKQAHNNDTGISTEAFEPAGWALFQTGPESILGTHVLGEEEHAGIPPVISCPTEFEFKGELCQRVHYARGTPSCSKKADLYENGLCIAMESMKPIMKCPEGAFSDGKRCFEVNYLAPLPMCSNDHKLTDDGMGCVPRSHVRTESTCPDGFSKIFNKCIREKRFASTPSCPPEYSLTYGHLGAECFNAHVVTQEITCKGIGYTIRDGQCVRIETAPTVAKCAPGFKDQGDGFCAMTEVVMADTVCPEGSTRSSKGCVTSRMESVIPSCKKEFSFHNGLCERYEEKSVDLKCPEGFKHKDGTCTMRQIFEAEKVCPPGSLARDKGCYVRREVPSTTYCESGRLDESGMCVETSFIEPTPYCLDGNLVKGICEQKHTIQPDVSCPAGAHLDGSKCISFHKIAPDTHCKSTGLKPGPEGCTTAETGDMFVQCPKDWKLYGDQCFRDVTSPKLHVCPTDMTLNGKKCEARKIINAELVCPKGYSSRGGKCVSIEEESLQQCCPPSYRLTFGQCLPHTSKTKALRKLSAS